MCTYETHQYIVNETGLIAEGTCQLPAPLPMRRERKGRATWDVQCLAAQGVEPAPARRLNPSQGASRHAQSAQPRPWTRRQPLPHTSQRLPRLGCLRANVHLQYSPTACTWRQPGCRSKRRSRRRQSRLRRQRRRLLFPSPPYMPWLELFTPYSLDTASQPSWETLSRTPWPWCAPRTGCHLWTRRSGR